VSWIYIIAVIVFAILSNVNKAGKGKGQQKPRGAMPTFGGGGVNTRKSLPRDQDTRSDAPPAFPKPAAVPKPDYVSGEGVSMEQPGEEGAQARLDAMQREFEQLHSSFDKISGENGSKPEDSNTAGKRKTGASGSRAEVQSNQLQNGLIWAEILGPPRAVRPHHSRKL
jgi:hypothetical protein